MKMEMRVLTDDGKGFGATKMNEDEIEMMNKLNEIYAILSPKVKVFNVIKLTAFGDVFFDFRDADKTNGKFRRVECKFNEFVKEYGAKAGIK